MKVLVLGGTGVIGNQIASSLISNKVGVTILSRGIISNNQNIVGATFVKMDLVNASEGQLISLLSEHEFVINAAGVIKQRISETNLNTQLEAIQLNAVLPYKLASLTDRLPIKIINITTDCVFDGARGNYRESESHNALDIYGRSKSLGEVQADNVLNLRCSVIGPDTTSLSLAGWILKQSPNAKITGFMNHFWNGITTYSLSKIIVGIIQSGFWNSGTQHLIPSNSWTKYELVQELTEVCNRLDLTLIEGFADQDINRILQTAHPEQNSILWNLAGYLQCPSLGELFQEPAFRNAF
jgi:dTDP-4-dehydrorhamnose reductase